MRSTLRSSLTSAIAVAVGVVLPTAALAKAPVKAAPILTGSQSSYITVSQSAGVCTCTACTLRAGRTTVRFEYDPEVKNALDAAGRAAEGAADKQAASDVKAQAAAPGLCASSCAPQGVATSVTSATSYGGSGGNGSTSAGWKITGSCVDTKKFISVPDHPTISVPTTGAITTRGSTPTTVTLAKPTYEKPLAEVKPSYAASSPSLGAALATKPTPKLQTFTPAKPPAPMVCAKGQRVVTVAGKSVCSGAAGAAAAIG